MKHESETTARTEGDQAWVARARVLLDEWEFDLDAPTASRLNRARQAALASLPRQSASFPWARWLGGGALAAGLVLLLLRQPEPVHQVPPASEAAPQPRIVSAPPLSALAPELVAAPDFEMLTDAERLALLEDLEFYAWLDAQAQSDG